MAHAPANGHLDVVECCVEEREPRTTQAAVVGAAAFGHLDVVQWLHSHQADGVATETIDRKGSTKLGMDLASRGGKLDVVRWLHENRSEGCTTAVMDSAANSGHLDFKKWMHANRSEGCTSSALINALTSSYPKIAKWLLPHRPECAVPNSSFVGAADARGCLEVLRWFHARFPETVYAATVTKSAATAKSLNCRATKNGVTVASPTPLVFETVRNRASIS
ncbi:hypothetical protein ON010_g9769 [Phytophthora cinnamomi]|nr:hypothetical protein ON010_g9769 [Phytophthora cinnamomi]